MSYEEQIANIRADVGALTKRLNGVEADIRSFGLGGEPIAGELVSIEHGPTRVAMLDMGGTGSLETWVNKRLAELEAAGATIVDILFAHAVHGDYQEGTESYAVCIVYREPATGGTDGNE